MQTPPRLRLKAEVITRAPGPTARSYPCARIWVDSGVFHLDRPYDYSVPEELSSMALTGVRVQVPFNGREVEGVVLERLESSFTSAPIKAISKVLSPHPVATIASLKLIGEVAHQWAANPWEVLRSAIPARVAGVDRTFSQAHEVPQEITKKSRSLTYIAFEPHIDPSDQLSLLVDQIIGSGSVLIIAPDERDITAICEQVKAKKIRYIRLDSSLPRAERYRNYLMAMDAKNHMIIGARSAVFTPIKYLKTIIVYKELSHEHYEMRAPGWNVRDVATLRRKNEDIDLIFTGYSPSLELAALIENKELKYIARTHRLRVKAFSSSDGALLPGRIFPEIRKALALGPALFIMPRKGYGNALLCAHCKNLAICSCGARLIVPSRAAPPVCLVCATTYPGWRCTWCARDKQYVAARGIERAAEEISRAFPGIPTILSYGDVIKSRIENKSTLVLSTPGAAPSVEGGYGAVILLEGLKFFSHPDLRAQERARELFFESAAMVNSNGAVLLSIQEEHPIVASLARWSPGAMIRREMAERLEIPLAPFVSNAIITGDQKEFASIASGLHKAISDQRLPATVQVFGPTIVNKAVAKIVLSCPLIDLQALTIFLHEFKRRRSIAKKEYLTIRINPYSL